MRWNPGTATRLGRTRSVIRSLYASLSPEDRVSSQAEQVDRQKAMFEVRSVPIRGGALPLRSRENFGPAYDAIVSFLLLPSSYLRRNVYQFSRPRVRTALQKPN